ncbi:hypothetical protein GP486_002542 [Trichoglossum hirsutum]|uniref:Uncharacterized protein n=1 Tax=Trichoglossum hirsutum TaxID=265104 RepID=A0A9P8LE34_9PEZI|nr:hypothetical protein GP486_002542 [Trichoglossum hirsutum]
MEASGESGKEVVTNGGGSHSRKSSHQETDPKDAGKELVSNSASDSVGPRSPINPQQNPYNDPLLYVEPPQPPGDGRWRFLNLHWAALRTVRWSLLWLVLTALLLAATIALTVRYAGLKRQQSSLIITITTPLVGDALPIVNSSLGAAAIVLGSFFSITTSPNKPLIKAVYDGGGKLCVRTEDSSWRRLVQCVEGANPKPHTPLMMLDRIGGPSIYFITAENLLSGIDNTHTNDTWKLSNLINFRRKVHEQSQLTSITWLNGSSAGVHFQDPDLQLREFGKDD